MAGIAKYTAAGITARRDALAGGVALALATFKVSSSPINLEGESVVEDLPDFWIEEPITSYKTIGTDRLEFSLYIPKEKAVNEGHSFALYLQDGTPLIVGTPPNFLNYGIAQEYLVQVEFLNNDAGEFSFVFIPASAGPKGDTGATGAVGPAGLKILNGTTAPATTVGVVGDMYLDTTTWNLYAKTATTTWTLKGNIKGATGATGAIGPAGAKGATGAIGPAGATGAIGPAGAKGATGATGAIGPAGAKGATGATGAIGPAGADAVVAKSNNTNGYIKFSSGTIMQWGITLNTDTSEVFPIAFPNYCFNVIMGVKDATNTNSFSAVHISTKSWTKTGFQKYGGTSLDGSRPWVAIGS